MSHWLINPRSEVLLKSLRWFKRLEIFQFPQGPDSNSASWGAHCCTVRPYTQVRVGNRQLQLRASVKWGVKAALENSLWSTHLAKEVCVPPWLCVASPSMHPIIWERTEYLPLWPCPGVYRERRVAWVLGSRRDCFSKEDTVRSWPWKLRCLYLILFVTKRVTKR